MSSTLTASLEKMNAAITRLEQALETRLNQVAAQQRDLFSQLDLERDRTKAIAHELDDVIAQIERTLQSGANQTNPGQPNSSSVQS